MEKISQLMDGELGRRESRQQILLVGTDPGLNARWDTYHLIRDVLRNECDLAPDFVHRLHERLEDEPVVVAPHQLFPYRLTRYSGALAAGALGVMLVAAVVGSLPWNAPRSDGTRPLATLANNSPAIRAVGTDGQVSEYLLAHQEFSPRTAMQGVASYVRTVPAPGSDPAE